MSYLSRWFELQENFGNGTANFAKDFSKKVGQAYCGIWAKYPNLLKLNPFTKGFMNGMCSNIGGSVPVVVPPPFQGGQCNFGYQLFMRFSRTQLFAGQCQNVKDPSASSPLQLFATVWGPIQSVTLSQPKTATCGSGFSAFSVVCHGDYSGSRKANPVTVTKQLTNPVGETLYTNIDELVVTPVGGVPDTCGDLPSTYPPDPPLEEGDFIQDIDVNIYDGTGVSIDTVSIDVDFGWNTVNNNGFNLSFPIAINAGDVNVTLDFEGVNVTNNPNGSGGDSTITLKEPFNPDDFKVSDDSNPDPDGVEEEEVINEKIAWVAVKITQFPNKGKTILHSDPLDNDYFAGYLNWLYEDGESLSYSESIPIRKERMIFKSPRESVGYRIYAVNDAKLKATPYVSKDGE